MAEDNQSLEKQSLGGINSLEINTLVEGKNLVELVVGIKTGQFYKKGEGSRTDELNGREISPKAFYPPRVVPLCERLSRPGETLEEYKRRAIRDANPNKSYFNAYLACDELGNGGSGRGSSKVSVLYCKI